MCVILCGVDVVLVREGISRSHLCSWSNLPDDVKVLKEEGPACLVMRKFVRILQIGQAFMVSENRDRMRSSLQVLFLFHKGKNDSQELLVIDVIVLFYSREGLGEVSAGMKVARGIRLHQDCTSCKEGGICHERKGARDVQDTKDGCR